jgi:hypothetical protein
MDRSLPFSFLDHKVKCGNSLVGAWFDQFQHYPVMAWKNREGGDKNHTNGVHFQEGARTKAIKTFVKDRLTPDLRQFLAGRTLFSEDMQQEAGNAHEEALAILARVHDLPVQDSAERARLYREQVLGSAAYRSLKEAMDLWCTCWFWSADDLAYAPLPSTLAAPPEKTRAIAGRIAGTKRFFHWELEFPDVFRASGGGFDAILGNPPWDTLQPNSKEFFSSIDPLYRSYGKQAALRQQTSFFQAEGVELGWLEYCAGFASDATWMKFAAFPFGDPEDENSCADRFLIARGRQNKLLHDRWRKARVGGLTYSDVDHPFRHRGEGKAYTYKLFLDLSYTLLARAGRLGCIVPFGLCSDAGSRDLRLLFLDRCRWEWLFVLENRDGIFPIHRSFKFGPVILQKTAQTHEITAAFMRHDLSEWQLPDPPSLQYSRKMVSRLSPASLIIVAFSDASDLAAVERMCTAGERVGSSLAGNSPGWIAVRSCSQGDINLTSASAKVWRSDSMNWADFSREGLWTRRKCPGVGSTSDLGAPVLPIFQGAMFHQFDANYGAFDGGSGHSVRWRTPDADDAVHPQFWAPAEMFVREGWGDERLVCRRVVGVTDERTIIAALVPPVPCSDTTLVFEMETPTIKNKLLLAAVLNSFCFDWIARRRIAGAAGASALDFQRLHEIPVPRPSEARAWEALGEGVAALNLSSPMFAPTWLRLTTLGMRLGPPSRTGSRTLAERLRRRCVLDVLVAFAWRMSKETFARILSECNLAPVSLKAASADGQLDPRGFWRVDKEKDPELRHTVLTVVAFHDLEHKIEECGGDRDKGLEAFLSQNDGEGWMLPETLCLAEYGLGHDDRAKQHQPVASRLGPRFFDWQLTQSAEESWRECHLHARNLLGEAAYEQLVSGSKHESDATSPTSKTIDRVEGTRNRRGRLFE